MTATVRTRVAIVGAGPAGLLLSHLLAGAGIESVVIDQRTREQIETTIRAGILEQGTVEVLDTLGDFSRARTVGIRHDGIELRFAGDGHRIDFAHARRARRLAVPAARGAQGPHRRAPRGRPGPALRRHRRAGRGCRDGRARASSPRTPTGRPLVIEADFVVGADGSRSVVRAAVTGSSTGGYFREYPFAWFGILCEAPPSAPRADLQQLRRTASRSSASAARPCSACTSSAIPRPTRTR